MRETRVSLQYLVAAVDQDGVPGGEVLQPGEEVVESAGAGGAAVGVDVGAVEANHLKQRSQLAGVLDPAVTCK